MKEDYSGGRNYHAVVYRPKRLDSAIDVAWSALTDNQLPPKPDLDTIHPIRHGWYITENIYVRNENVERVPNVSDGRFRYDFYLSEIGSDESSAVMIAFPFRGLGRDLRDRLNESARLRPLLAGAANLPDLVTRVRRGRYGAETRLSEYGATVHGDTFIDRLVLQGEDPTNSDVFGDLTSHFRLEANRCVLKYVGESGPTVRLHIDVYGNFRFYLRVNAVNLVSVCDAISTLLADDLMEFGVTSPFQRTYLEETDNGGGAGTA